MSVICDQANACPERDECGGAQPHNHCEECGNCPFDKSAECVDIIQKNVDQVVGV